MVKVFRLCLALLFALVASAAQASFVAPVVSQYKVVNTSVWYPTAQAACNAISGAGTVDLPDCWASNGFRYTLTVANSQVCPVNSTGVATACTCDSGYVESGASCVVAPPPQKCTDAKGGADLFTGFTVTPVVGSSFCPSDGAASGCGSKITGGFGYVKNGVKTWTYEVEYNGLACTPPTSGVLGTETTCKGTVGTVNGVTVCSPPSDRNVIESIKSTTATNPVSGASAPGTAGSTTSSDSTVCTGAKCTTTTTTTTTTAAGVSTTTTETKEQPQEDFCTANPRSMACKEFTLGEVAGEAVASNTVNLAINKAPSFGPDSAACPAPKTVTVLGINLVMPYTLLCDVAAMIRPLLIGFAYLSAALTFFGFAKK